MPPPLATSFLVDMTMGEIRVGDDNSNELRETSNKNKKKKTAGFPPNRGLNECKKKQYHQQV